MYLTIKQQIPYKRVGHTEYVTNWFLSPLTSHTLKLMNTCKDFQNLIKAKVYINVP